MEWNGLTLINSEKYLNKKSFFDNVLTIYGRNAVLEALKDNSLIIHKLHLSTSNKSVVQLDNMIKLAQKKSIDVSYHDKKALSRISKNSKQDQGVALDIIMPKAISVDKFLSTHNSYTVIALDGIHNPQNLGMIIRSATAGNIDAIILPTKKSAQISPLVIKASVGTLFKLPIIKTNNLTQTLKKFQSSKAKLYTLSSHAKKSYKDEVYTKQRVFVLGNESDGVSNDIESLCDSSISIPMNRGVESLNVAVTASLLAFL